MSAIEQGLHLAAKPSAIANIAPAAYDQAKSSWASQKWPTRKTEAWKYTPLKILANGDYFDAPAVTGFKSDSSQAQAITALYNIKDLNAISLVFVDGYFQPALSTLTGEGDECKTLASAEGLEVTLFSEANVEQKQTIQQYFDSAAAEHATLFGQLNSSTSDQGVLVTVGKNAVIEQTIHIVHVSTSSNKAAANARLLWVQEANSQANVVEHFVGQADAKLLTHSVTELIVGENASCQHYRLHLEPEDCLHIGGVYSHLAKHARLNSFYLAMGTQLQRVDVVTQFEGEGAEATNNGVYLPRNQQLVDFHTCIEHKVPHCTSQEIFRGIIGDQARAVFNGRIHIHKDAQKTLAELSNKNLLTSDKAEVNTKPELEIYADDVRCAHGATVAELDGLAMHYLRTRGISYEEAQVMLSFGFINELIEMLPNESIIQYLRPLIAKRFAKDPELTQHLIVEP